MKIVSLLPSATEIVYALGLEDWLCAVSGDCDYPPEAKTKPAVSLTALALDDGAEPDEVDRAVRERVEAGEPIYRLDRELIQQLQPDLILAQDLCRVCAVPSGHVTEALDVIGCSADVISLDPSTLGEVIAGIEQVAEASGIGARGRELAAELRRRVEAVSTRTRTDDRPRVLALEWPDPPFTGGHWVPEMVSLAGGRDVLGVAAAPSRSCSWDEIVGASPEIVVYMPCGYGLDDSLEQAHQLYRHPSFAATPAARDRNVYAVDASSYFSRPGPRLIDGLEILACVLNPDRFPEPPPGRVARVA